MVVPVSLAEMPGNVVGCLMHQPLATAQQRCGHCLCALAVATGAAHCGRAADAVGRGGILVGARWFLVPVRGRWARRRVRWRLATTPRGWRRDQLGVATKSARWPHSPRSARRLGASLRTYTSSLLSDSGALNYRFVRVELAETVRRIADGMQAAFASAGLLADHGGTQPFVVSALAMVLPLMQWCVRCDPT